MKGLLIRVGVDQTAGGFNGPIDVRTNRFAYIPIPEAPDHQIRSGHQRIYDTFEPALRKFNQQLPESLKGTPAHLDPDFEQLTYRDQGQRASKY